MGKLDGNEPYCSTCSRVVIAILLGLGILLVVLLTCLLQVRSIESADKSPQLLPNSTSPQLSAISSPTPSWPIFSRTSPSLDSSTPPSLCPSRQPNLQSFPSGSDIVLGNGISYILDRNVSVDSVTIMDSASLTVKDDGTPIVLRTKYILIMNQGALIIGSELCRHSSPLEIILYGKFTDPDESDVFGKKFIGVTPTGTIDIHGSWKLSWTFLNTNIYPGREDLVLNLTDVATSWNPGDRIVIASSDYDMNHAEEFELMDCNECSEFQIKIKGPVKYWHQGSLGFGGVDMRAEVGLLTRNIKIHGEMEPQCYGDNFCQFFDFDTFGGSTHVLQGTRLARFEGIELYNMGQQVLGRYPIHYHRVFDSYNNYAKQLSIHHCFSRCVTLHSAIGLLVEDVVGYDTLGHCFFLEDGNELNNTFRHNLGLVTRAATLLPSDRNDEMCVNLTANRTVYIPDPDRDCKAVSTFWISHPSNNLIDNSAAGSEEMGYFCVFHRIPTGPSEGLLPPFHGERSPLGLFIGNRAHSNRKTGFEIDHGVKIDPPTPQDPRDFLAMDEAEKYQPHVDRNLSLPRAPARFANFTSYMNSLGLFARGGDVWFWNAKLSDNDVGVLTESSAYLPYDQGSHQELINSIIVGRSTYNSAWDDRGVPCVGMEIRDGPVLIRGNQFYNFPVNSNRTSYAIGFLPNNTGQNSPANTIQDNTFHDVVYKLFFGQVGGGLGSYFGSYDLDGDLTQIVFDESGDIAGDSMPVYVVRPDYPLLNDSFCRMNGSYKFCEPRDYGQLFVNATSKRIRFAIEDLTNYSEILTLKGVDREDEEHPTTTQFQPVLTANHTYRINWLDDTPPSNLNFSMNNFDQYSFVFLKICYPPSTVILEASLLLLNQATDTCVKTSDVPMSFNYEDLENTNIAREAQFFWNATLSALYVKLQVTWQSPGYSYCASDGCHFFHIIANVSHSGQYNCSL